MLLRAVSKVYDADFVMEIDIWKVVELFFGFVSICAHYSNRSYC